MTQAMQVRLAKRSDEAALVDLCHALHQENGLFTLDDDMVRAMLHRAFDRKGGVIGVIGDENRIEGAIYLLFSTFWYSKDSHLEELFNFVRPESRKSNHATELVEFAKRCSDAIGIPLLIGVLTNQRMESKVRLYRRKLGAPSGAFFVYGSKWNVGTAPNDDIWRVHSRGGRRRHQPPSLELNGT